MLNHGLYCVGILWNAFLDDPAREGLGVPRRSNREESAIREYTRVSPILFNTLLTDVSQIMAQASPFCKLPEDVAEKVKAAGTGTGLVASWAPLRVILEHPVTGWFLTHGGSNSITASIDAGVPLDARPCSLPLYGTLTRTCIRTESAGPLPLTSL